MCISNFSYISEKWHHSVTYLWYYPHNILLNCIELDEMGQRIDDLEKNIAELMTQAGVEEK